MQKAEAIEGASEIKVDGPTAQYAEMLADYGEHAAARERLEASHRRRSGDRRRGRMPAADSACLHEWEAGDVGSRPGARAGGAGDRRPERARRARAARSRHPRRGRGNARRRRGGACTRPGGARGHRPGRPPFRRPSRCAGAHRALAREVPRGLRAPRAVLRADPRTRPRSSRERRTATRSRRSRASAASTRRGHDWRRSTRSPVGSACRSRSRPRRAAAGSSPRRPVTSRLRKPHSRRRSPWVNERGCRSSSDAATSLSGRSDVVATRSARHESR